MIRTATEADIPDLIRMAEAFHNAAMARHGVQFSRSASEMTARGLLASPRCLALVLDKGHPAGLLCAREEDYPVGAAIFARELIFWIDPEHRGKWAIRMLQAYEAWAVERGVRLIGMTCFDDGRTGRLYERLGYRATETNFIKAA